MSTAIPHILTINGGSSSIRFAVFQAGKQLQRTLHGKLDRIGQSGTELTFNTTADSQAQSLSFIAHDLEAAAQGLVDWLLARQDCKSVVAVGHRIVHGMQHSEPELVTAELLDELRGISFYDPDHLPLEIDLIETFLRRRPQLAQVACFDTAFHRTMPRVARMLAIPRRYEAMGVQRYGFHGLSYAYLMEELSRLGDPAAKTGRVILLHLGSGASLAAVLNGQGMDTSMGFTPTAGLPMSTRCGDLDPGLVSYFARTEKMSAARFSDMTNHESGLLGLSELSADMRELLALECVDVRAAEAVALFCYQAKKWIGSFAAALGGLDTLVFAGGVGENAPQIRARICEGLAFLGVKLSPDRNTTGASLISPDYGRVKVRVIRTDEERMIASYVTRILNIDSTRETMS